MALRLASAQGRSGRGPGQKRPMSTINLRRWRWCGTSDVANGRAWHQPSSRPGSNRPHRRLAARRYGHVDIALRVPASLERASCSSRTSTGGVRQPPLRANFGRRLEPVREPSHRFDQHKRRGSRFLLSSWAGVRHPPSFEGIKARAATRAGAFSWSRRRCDGMTSAWPLQPLPFVYGARAFRALPRGSNPARPAPDDAFTGSPGGAACG